MRRKAVVDDESGSDLEPVEEIGLSRKNHPKRKFVINESSDSE